jgi:hypothetical protein
MVSIEVSIPSPDCLPVVSPGGGLECKKRKCEALVKRTWNGLPPNSTMSWCTIYSFVPPVYYCYFDPGGNPPNAGASGSGLSITADDVPCGGSATFTIRTQCGTSATATAFCEDYCYV